MADNLDYSADGVILPAGLLSAQLCLPLVVTGVWPLMHCDWRVDCDWRAASRPFLMEHAARGDRAAAGILRDLLLSVRAPGEMGVGVRVRAAVGVCTAQRPRMLAHCLDAIGAQILPHGTELHVVVADNEREPNSRCVVDRFEGY
jgi:hypothetical protein